MTKIRVAINGFGRIGRAFFRVAKDNPEIEIVAINDLADIENLAYLLKYDSVYGKSDFQVFADKTRNVLVIDGKEIKFISEKNPELLPWKSLSIDVVVESTGFFTSYDKSKSHLIAGAKRVVITAPVKDSAPEGIVGRTVLVGINEKDLEVCHISSNASCTTNAGSPVLAVLKETIGVEKALLNTVHAYTSAQRIVDSPDAKDWRKGRAGGVNIIPSTTGAAIATTKAIKELEGNFDGVALRVPVVAGSIADITFIAKRETTKEEINEIFKKASKEEKWKGILDVTEEPLVSSDIIGNPHAAVVDLAFTRVVGGNLVKVLSWYDNEVGYSHTLLRHVIATGRYAKTNF